MTSVERFPRYIQRSQEQMIIEQALRVRDDGASRAVLLYGTGGTGKTRLVRHLADAVSRGQETVWLDPIDVDDSQHWLLSNLERNVVRQLDPDQKHFSPYIEYLFEIPRYAGQRATSYATALGHLARVKAIFERCYKSYVEDIGTAVVMTFDTVEAIRSMNALFTLTQWIKALPGTLFVLAGRPPTAGWGAPDPVKVELREAHSGIPVTEVRLGEFGVDEARKYFEQSGVAKDLSHEEKEKLICLTRGHPLWLAFTIDYLTEVGMPSEANESVQYIKHNLPLPGDATLAGQVLADKFRRRLVAPYRETDFWHEAIRRLAVVRESMSQPVWRELMSDVPLPDDVPDADSAWALLRQTEWIRPRANRRYITLHDAVAEELSQRVIQLDDPDERWRQDLWRKATSIYSNLAGQMDAEIAERQASVDARLRQLGQARLDDRQPAGAGDDGALIRDVTAIDRRRQEVSHLRSAQIFYQLLSDFAGGAEEFLALLGQARREHKVGVEDLLAFQMERLLPDGPDTNPLGDAVLPAVARFQDWLRGSGSDRYADIGLELAAFLIDREQLGAALKLLDRLPVAPSDYFRNYRLNNLRGNARMRIPGQVLRAAADFKAALAVAVEGTSANQLTLIAEGYKELGFYYRNIGLWDDANDAYREARDAISTTLSVNSPDSHLEEIASIQTNWAYLKGIGGDYRDGISLVESAISIRRRIGRQHEVAMSLSVRGEVYRYRRSFDKAWIAYAEAEQIFEELDSWSWLGQIYQEQAICLFQAMQDDVGVISDPQPIDRAEELILRSLNLCHELNARAYPSALNRAGRIFGSRDADRGLAYLNQAAEAARVLSDGWFWFASLIEYAELSLRTWLETEAERYMEQIATVAADMQVVMQEYGFPELRGRWDVLQGHMGLRRALDLPDPQGLAVAFENYKRGFPLITHGYVGSFGVSVIPAEIRRFGDLINRLPTSTREQWLAELRRSWSGEGASTLLLARLTELYQSWPDPAPGRHE